MHLFWFNRNLHQAIFTFGLSTIVQRFLKRILKQTAFTKFDLCFVQFIYFLLSFRQTPLLYSVLSQFPNNST